MAVAGLCETVSYYNGVSLKSTTDIDFPCLRTKGFKFMAIRGYLSYGKVDPNVAKNYHEANQGTTYYPLVTMNPCVQCSKLPQEQVIELIKAIGSNDKYSIVVKIQPSDNWGSDAAGNCAYLKLLLTTVLQNNKYATIQSDAPIFNKIMGQNCDVTSTGSIGIIWDKHDGRKEIVNFIPFGGIKNTKCKEYTTDTVCNTYVDLIICAEN